MKRKLSFLMLLLGSCLLLSACTGVVEPLEESPVETVVPPQTPEAGENTAEAAEEQTAVEVLPPRNLPVPVLGQEVRRVNGNRLTIPSLMQVGEWLYLNLPTPVFREVPFYMMKEDGSTQIMISESTAYDLQCIGDFIYFGTREEYFGPITAYCRLPLAGGVLEVQDEPFAEVLTWEDSYSYREQRYIWREDGLYRDQELFYPLPEGYTAISFDAWDDWMVYVEQWWSEEEIADWGYGGNVYGIKLLNLETAETKQIKNEFSGDIYFNDYFEDVMITERFVILRWFTGSVGQHSVTFWDRELEDYQRPVFYNQAGEPLEFWPFIAVAVGDYLYLEGWKDFQDDWLIGVDERNLRYWDIAPVYPDDSVNKPDIYSLSGGEDSLYLYFYDYSKDDDLYELYRFDLETGAASRIWESL